MSALILRGPCWGLMVSPLPQFRTPRSTKASGQPLHGGARAQTWSGSGICSRGFLYRAGHGTNALLILGPLFGMMFFF